MKRTYKKPQIQSILTDGPILMVLQGTVDVSLYKKGEDVNIGDTDEPIDENPSSVKDRGMSLF